ncbi:MAG: hypothetical protein AB1467_00210 [Candidatus Diapherotrites archaeon]
MKAVFEVKEVVQDWSPPFQKKVNVKNVEVNLGEGFELNEKGIPIFKLIKLDGNKALVEHDRSYSTKGHEHVESRQVWVDKEEAKSFCALWSSNGITKSLLLIELIE